MFTTYRHFFPHGIEGEAMDCTMKEWESLEKAVAYCHRYAKGVRFDSVYIEDEDGELIYEITSNGIITDSIYKHFNEKIKNTKNCEELRKILHELPETKDYDYLRRLAFELYNKWA